MNAAPLAIRRTAQARADILEIWLYLAERSPAAADRVLDAIERLFRVIASHPLIGRERPELSPGIRSFVVMSWVVFYRAQPDAVEIVRVVPGARDLESLEY